LDMEDLKQDKSDGKKEKEKKEREPYSLHKEPCFKSVGQMHSVSTVTHACAFFIFTLYLQRRVHSWVLVFVCG